MRARRHEIEHTAVSRVHAIADAAATGDPEYIAGLRAAVAAAVEYGIAAVEQGEEHVPPVPEILLTQARLAAQSGISLDTVLRRYLAGYTLFNDFLMQETDVGAGGSEAKRIMQAQATPFDRLVAAIGEAHESERGGRPDSPEEQRLRRVKRLLQGETVETASLGYEFDASHLGVVVRGPDGLPALRRVASQADRALMFVRPDDDLVWAWLGGRRGVSAETVYRALAAALPTSSRASLGEPADGMLGWRLTHEQARAAQPLAQHTDTRAVRYADVGLLASAIRDETLVVSLRRLYIDPLRTSHGEGESLRETLRAYLAVAGNVTSTAAALAVDRRTVSRRIRTIEALLGRTVLGNHSTIELALSLWDLDERRTAQVGQK